MKSFAAAIVALVAFVATADANGGAVRARLGVGCASGLCGVQAVVVQYAAPIQVQQYSAQAFVQPPCYGGAVQQFITPVPYQSFRSFSSYSGGYGLGVSAFRTRGFVGAPYVGGSTVRVRVRIR